MYISSKLILNNSEDIRHQVEIAGIPIVNLKKGRKNYFLKVKKKYTYQKTVVKVLLDKSLFINRHNVSEKLFAIELEENKINVYIDKNNVNLIKKMGRYRLSYTLTNNDRLSIKVKTYFKQDFYNNVVIPRLKKLRIKEAHTKRRRRGNTNPHDDLLRRDFQNADKFPYPDSPNSDGNRSKKEVFGGAFSGISKSGRKR